MRYVRMQRPHALDSALELVVSATDSARRSVIVRSVNCTGPAQMASNVSTMSRNGRP